MKEIQLKLAEEDAVSEIEEHRPVAGKNWTLSECLSFGLEIADQQCVTNYRARGYVLIIFSQASITAGLARSAYTACRGSSGPHQEMRRLDGKNRGLPREDQARHLIVRAE